MESIIKEPDALVFDWDGTLVDTMEGVFNAHNHVRTYMNCPVWTQKEFITHMRHSSRVLYPRLYGARAQEGIDVLYSYIEDNLFAHLKPLPGADDLLCHLAELGIPIGIVSNKRHDYLTREIEHLNWTSRFVSIIGAGKSEKDKPDAAPLLDALQHMTIEPHAQSVWYVGDTETDMLTAKNAACGAVLITNGEDQTDLVNIYRPLHVCQNCEELKNLLPPTPHRTVEINA